MMQTQESWHKFLAIPSFESDIRLRKRMSVHHNFTQSTMKEVLWVDGRWTPPWVGAGLVSTTQQGSADSKISRFSECTLELQRTLNTNYHRVKENDGFLASYLNSVVSREICGEGPEGECFQEQYISNRILVHRLHKCLEEKDLASGRELHSFIVRSRLESDTFLGSHLIRMFSFFDCLFEANQVFSRISQPNVYAWSAIITAHAKVGLNEQAIDLYYQMQMSSVEPDGHVFVAVLKACSSIAALKQGKQVHCHIIKSGFELDAFIGSALIDMYVKCGCLEEAHKVFEQLPRPDVVIWSALIAGYVQHKNGRKALQLFKQMQEKGLEPDQVTFASIMQACSSIGAIEQGKQIHALVIESGLESDLYVASTLIDGYVKCGCLEFAHAVFDRLPKQNVVTWSTLISGYAQQGNGKEALQLFQQMQLEGMQPNQATYVSIFKACSSIAALEQGRQMHGNVIENGLSSDITVGNALIDMYAKLGSIDDACRVFCIVPLQNVVTWSVLIAGYSQLNDYSLALQCFKCMQQAGLKPDDVTFLCLLSACSHMGLVDEGCLYFKSMREEHGLSWRLEHYNCLVNLFSHAGCMNEAEELLETIPVGPNIEGWMSLLSSCRTHVNVDLGRRCFNHVIAMDCGSAAGYVLMSNIYVHAGMQDDAEQIEKLRRCANGWKIPGKAFIEVDSQVHTFIVGDTVHPRSNDIYAKLKTLSVEMKKEGYRPCLDLVLDMVSDEKKEDALCGHCEKLAIAFGLICIPQGTTIRVAKNLRMCADCHNATKVISKIEMREIIVVDSYCVHQFQEGACSCKDMC